jgi:hypothetical protein
MKFLLGVFAIGAVIGFTLLKRKKDESPTQLADEPSPYNGAAPYVGGDPDAATPQVTHG